MHRSTTNGGDELIAVGILDNAPPRENNRGILYMNPQDLQVPSLNVQELGTSLGLPVNVDRDGFGHFCLIPDKSRVCVVLETPACFARPICKSSLHAVEHLGSIDGAD